MNQGLTIDELRPAVVDTHQKQNTSKQKTRFVLGISRSSFRYQVRAYDDEASRPAIIRSAKPYGRYGYRKVTVWYALKGGK